MTQAQQTVPVRVYHGSGRIMVAAPLPGMEPADISVTICGDTLTIRGARRGPRQDTRDLTTAEWAVGPYLREVNLRQPVHSARTNATYGNGVLVVVLPKRPPGTTDVETEIRLEVIDATRGQWVGHSGQDLHETTTLLHRQQMDATIRKARSAGTRATTSAGQAGGS